MKNENFKQKSNNRLNIKNPITNSKKYLHILNIYRSYSSKWMVYILMAVRVVSNGLGRKSTNPRVSQSEIEVFNNHTTVLQD